VSDRKLTAELLLAGYASGIFPMSETRDDPDIFWVRPKKRGIFELGKFHVSRSLSRRIKKSNPVIRINTRFKDVVEACADREETWINAQIFDLYLQLHDKGFAHSLEVYDQDNQLWGGVFGIALGGAFFGESMFSAATDGSKIALTYLVARLRYGGFQLFDTQFTTDHLASLGAVEIDRTDYETRLGLALQCDGDFSALAEDADYDSVMQLITQTS